MLYFLLSIPLPHQLPISTLKTIRPFLIPTLRSFTNVISSKNYWPSSLPVLYSVTVSLSPKATQGMDDN